MIARKKAKSTMSLAASSPSSAPAWPSYQGTSQLVGTSLSGRVTIYVDPSLGQKALQNAQDLLDDSDRIVTANDGMFGTTGGPVSVISLPSEAPQTALAAPTKWLRLHHRQRHRGGVAYGNSSGFGLFEAELSECSMNGNVCGESTGEASIALVCRGDQKQRPCRFATAPP